MVTTLPASSTTVTVAASAGTFLARLRAFCKLNVSAIAVCRGDRVVRRALKGWMNRVVSGVLLEGEPRSRNQGK